MISKPYVSLLALALLIGCGETTDDTANESAELGPYAACAEEEHVGSFEITLKDTFTAVQGTVTNAVRPSDVSEVTSTDGSCKLLQPKTLFCDPMCGSGETCGDAGTCVALPTNQSVGVVSISGLTAVVSMEARSPVFYYNHIGDLPHPAIQAGDEVVLSAAGDVIAPFSISTTGIEVLNVTTASMRLERDVPGVLDWTAGTAQESTKIEIELNIANHGGTPAKVQCLSDDSGHFEIPTSMVNALLDLGFSGFPSVRLTRAASNVATTDYGCVDFRAQSTTVLTVDIDGLTSCSDNSDCPTDQTCLANLTCG
jgi:hypothetical protein